MLVTIDVHFRLSSSPVLCKFQITSVDKSCYNDIHSGMQDTPELKTILCNFFNNRKAEKIFIQLRNIYIVLDFFFYWNQNEWSDSFLIGMHKHKIPTASHVEGILLKSKLHLSIIIDNFKRTFRTSSPHQTSVYIYVWI